MIENVLVWMLTLLLATVIVPIVLAFMFVFVRIWLDCVEYVFEQFKEFLEWIKP